MEKRWRKGCCVICLFIYPEKREERGQRRGYEVCMKMSDTVEADMERTPASGVCASRAGQLRG